MEQGTFTPALRGYDRAEVDAMVARIERSIAGQAGPDAVTPDEVRNSTFNLVWRGYSEDEVDAFLDHAIVELSGPSGPRRTTSEPQVVGDAVPGEAGEPGEAGTPDERGQSRSSTEKFREASELLALESKPRGERFAQSGLLAEGYAVEEVDAFVEYVRTALTARLSAAEVRNVQFTTTRRRSAYTIDEVDVWLDAIEAHVSDGG